MDKTCLITGGAGFIGSHLCDYLLETKYKKVVVLDNLILGKESNIKHLFNNLNFIFVKGDILNKELLENLFKEYTFDFVYHLAANSDIAISSSNPGVDFNNTLLTTFSVLECMRQYNVKKIFFASSSAIYGQTIVKISESYGPLLPVSHYGACKMASETLISSYSENYNIQAWIARFPNVVGERATHGVIFDFVKKLRKNSYLLQVLGDGKQNKPYLYVKDLIDAFLFMIEKSDEKINVFNIGTETRTTVAEIAKMVIEEMGLKSSIEYTGGNRGWIGDVPEFQYDLSKIHQLGWKAKISSNEAVKKSIKFILTKDNV